MTEIQQSAFRAGPDSARAVGATVHFQGVEKQYADVQALQPTTFDISSGEFFAILGPSGSGKSTLLGIAAGYVTPTGGHLLLNGRDIIGQPPYRRNIGMVFQNYALFPHMSVAENVSFPLRMRRLPKAESDARVRRMLDIVRLTGMEDRKPSQLSGGQQQRVALARAAVYSPLLLLMDEPLGALDKNLREAVQDEIKRFQRELGATVVYVTHDQQEAAAMADRIAIMQSGIIVQIGTPRELYERPANLFVASFLGEANIFPVRALQPDRGGAVLTTASGLSLRSTSASEVSVPVVACVRPECVALSNTLSDMDNRFAVEVIDVVYAVGSFRYRVRLPDGSLMTLRQRASGDSGPYAVGDAATVGWNASDTLVLPEA